MVGRDGSKLKRRVALGLASLAKSLRGGQRPRPDTSSRQGLFSSLMQKSNGEKSTMGELVELAWPIAAGMLGETALGLCDTALVGALGPAALAGVGVATAILFLGYALMFGLMRGVKVRAAYAVGEGRPQDAIRYAEAGAAMGLAAGVAIFALSRDVSGVLAWLGVAPSMIPYARDFVAARTFGAIGTCVGAALIQYLQGVGDSRSPMIVGLAGNVVNASLAYTLIHGKFGLPALGVRGAGYATAATEVLELVVLVWVVRQRAASAKRPTLARKDALREVATLGVPTGMHFVLEAMAFTAFTTILGGMRPEEMAAHQIALNVIRASFLPGVAVSEAASVLVARSLGRHRLDEADRVTRSSLALAVGFMSLCGVGFALFGGQLARGFTSDPLVVSMTRRLLLVAAVFQALDAVNMVLRGALRGAKDVRWVAIVGTTVVWIAVPGSALVLGRMAGLGALGGWLGFILETTFASALLWWRWSRGAWRAHYGEIVVEKEKEEAAPMSIPEPV